MLNFIAGFYTAGFFITCLFSHTISSKAPKDERITATLAVLVTAVFWPIVLSLGVAGVIGAKVRS